MGLPPPRQRAIRICPAMESCVRFYVDPEQWGQGIGMALVSAARANLFALGFRNAFLWVLEGNIRAERFYRIDQWAPDGLRRTDSMWGITVNELRYQRGL